MITSAIVNLYAKAFFSIAKEQQFEVKIRQDLIFLQNLLEQSCDFAKFIHSPLIKVNSRKDVLKQIAELYGLSNLTLHFLYSLTFNKRLALLAEVIKASLVIHSHDQGVESVQITFAIMPSEPQLENIKTYLEDILKKKINLELCVNPEILDGMIVQMGSKMFDNSLKHKLAKLELLSKRAISVI